MASGSEKWETYNATRATKTSAAGKRNPTRIVTASSSSAKRSAPFPAMDEIF